MISREYGLPCVAHLTRACELIPDGALITVDGGSGRVVVHESPEPPAREAAST
jgi:phosphohistidine swiveling domain-containing protein